MKQCAKCKQVKQAEEFPKDRKRSDGLYPYCKQCHSAAGKKNRDVQRKYAPLDEKVCITCDMLKSKEEFYLYPYSTTGLKGECKRCMRSRYMQKEFGIDADTYDRMLEEQGGGCKICFRPCSSGKILAVDHCHTTGKVRGLLCIRCNSALADMEDDIDRMKRMITYLEESRLES